MISEYEKNDDNIIKTDDKGNPIRSLKARGDKTEGRFPNLLDSLSSRIAKQALDVSTAVYAKAYQEKMSELVKLSPDPDKIAKALCYSMLDSEKNWNCTRRTVMHRQRDKNQEYFMCTRYEYIGKLHKNFDLEEEKQKDSSKYRTFIKYTSKNLADLLGTTDTTPSEKSLVIETKGRNGDKNVVIHKTVFTVESYENGICKIKQDSDCIYKGYDCDRGGEINAIERKEYKLK